VTIALVDGDRNTLALPAGPPADDLPLACHRRPLAAPAYRSLRDSG
jgi:hypothetical protein